MSSYCRVGQGSVLSLFFVFWMLLTTSAQTTSELPPGLSEALSHTQGLTFYSLHPDWTGTDKEEGERFQGFFCLDRVEIEGDEAQALGRAVLNDLETISLSAACFNPRHGLMCEGYEVLLCFECGRALIVTPSGERVGGNIAGTAREMCQEIIRKNNLLWSGWSKSHRGTETFWAHSSGIQVLQHEAYLYSQYESPRSWKRDTLTVESRTRQPKAASEPGFVQIKSEGMILRTIEMNSLDLEDVVPLLEILIPGSVGKLVKESRSLTWSISQRDFEQATQLLKELDGPSYRVFRVFFYTSDKERSVKHLPDEGKKLTIETNSLLVHYALAEDKSDGASEIQYKGFLQNREGTIYTHFTAEIPRDKKNLEEFLNLLHSVNFFSPVESKAYP